MTCIFQTCLQSSNQKISDSLAGNLDFLIFKAALPVGSKICPACFYLAGTLVIVVIGGGWEGLTTGVQSTAASVAVNQFTIHRTAPTTENYLPERWIVPRMKKLL